MNRCFHGALGLLGLLMIAGVARAQAAPVAPAPPAPPDEATARHGVDRLLARFGDARKPATVGLVTEAASRSILFGAPTWNEGDHEACCRFYRKTAESICAAFPDDKAATPAARPLIRGLAVALERVRQSKDVDRNAWSLRYAFDAIQLEYTLAVVRIDGEISLGNGCLVHGSFAEAEDAYTAACAALAELDGVPAATLSVENRCAPLALSNAQFAQGKYREASAAILRGLALLPDWPAAKFDPRVYFGDPIFYNRRLRDLQAQVRQHPQDAALVFLLGYYDYFTGSRDKAAAEFRQTLRIEPGHAGAKLFLDQKPAPGPEKPHENRHAPPAPRV